MILKYFREMGVWIWSSKTNQVEYLEDLEKAYDHGVARDKLGK